MANAYQALEDTSKREHYLTKAYALPGLRAKEKQFFAEELDKFYQEQAEAAHADGDEAALEKALKSALTYNEKSKAGPLLAKMYMERGLKLIEQEKLEDAVEILDKALALPVEGKVTARAESARDRARITLLSKQYKEQFESRKDSLVKAGKYDAKRNRWLSSLKVQIPDDLQGDAQLDEKAGAIGTNEAYKKLLSMLAEEAGTKLPEPIPDFNFSTWSVDRNVWVTRPTELSIAVSVDYEDGLQAMYFLQKISESRARAASAGKPGSAEPAADGEGQARAADSK